MNKLAFWSNGGIGLSMFGTFPVEMPGGKSFPQWLQEWPNSRLSEDAPVEIGRVLKKLCTDLDTETTNIRDNEMPVGLHVATWMKETAGKYPVDRIPVVMRVSRTNGKYASKPLVRKEVHDSIHSFLAKHEPDEGDAYATQVFADGLPNIQQNYQALRKLFASIVGQEVPKMNLSRWTEYVELLIDLSWRLYSAADMPLCVNRPIRVQLLSPRDFDYFQLVR